MVDLPSILRDIFGISSNFFRWPFVLTNLIIPFILFTYAMKLVLERLGIFKSEGVNYGISAIISLSCIVLLASMGPIVIVGSIFIISVMKMGAGLKAFGFGIVLAAIVYYILPFLINYLTKILT